MSVYYPTLILKEGQNNPYNDFSAQISVSTKYKSIDHSKLLSAFFFFNSNSYDHNEPHRLSNQKNFVYLAEIGD